MTERSLRSFLSQLNSLLFCAVCCYVLNKHDYDYEVVAVIRPKKPFEFPILAEKSVSISVKTFFLWRSPLFGLKNRLNFQFWPKISSQFRINRVILIQEQ